ncbi:hypothetical protein COCOBI_04-8240 [Coccomyxa sp. Obi]|nr:hypothetical protein COCOBI_04-8240 [Coccomyxa sp. Obi]
MVLQRRHSASRTAQTLFLALALLFLALEGAVLAQDGDGSQATEVQEENLSVTDNTEETYADTEGGDSLIDYGEEVGNKEPGTNSVGGASVSPHFNFTKAAELAVKHAAEEAAAAATAPATSNNSTDEPKQPAVTDSSTPSQQPATSEIPLADSKPKKKKKKKKPIRRDRAAPDEESEEDESEDVAQPASNFVTIEYEGTEGGGLAPPPDALGFVEKPDPDLAGLERPPPAAAAAPRPPITNELLDPTLLSEARTPAGPRATGAVAASVPAVPPAAVPRGGRAAGAAVESPPVQTGEPGGAAAAVTSPDDWVVNITTLDLSGAAHIAKRQARHYHSLPGTITPECQQRLLNVVREAKGAFYEHDTPEALFGNVSEVKLQQAKQQTDDLLATILAGSASMYTDFHLSHMTNNWNECLKSAGVEALKACLRNNRKQLRHADITWFDENFLAALRQLLPEVRSMFGFGSGRGDFERYFYEQGVKYTFGLEPGFMGELGFYAPGWEYREGPVQLTQLLPNASGLAELADFRCHMFGDSRMRVDLVQSFEVFEEIPRHEHCGIMNVLASMASRWLAVTMGQLGQGGGHHIANRHKEDFLSEWTRRGLVYRPDLTASIAKDCYMCQLHYLRYNLLIFELHYLRYNLLIFEVDPSRVEPVKCTKEGPADWAPYEDFEQQLVYLPNGTAVPSTKHQHAYGDWQYVLRLKAG